MNAAKKDNKLLWRHRKSISRLSFYRMEDTEALRRERAGAREKKRAWGEGERDPNQKSAGTQ